VHGLTHPQLETIVLVRRQAERSSLKQKLSPEQKELMEKTKDFWAVVTGSVSGRSVRAVYNHLRRLCSPDHRKGVWTADEDDNLRAAIANVGAQWEQVGAEVGRIAGDCKDRWRKVLEPKSKGDLLTGTWTAQEEELLAELVKDHGTNWMVIAQKMGTRSSTQIKDK